MQTEWDIVRFADHVKNSQVREDGGQSQIDLNLSQYFPQACFGTLHNPTTILDRSGHIAVWYLPDVIHPKRNVSHLVGLWHILSNLEHETDCNEAIKKLPGPLRRGREGVTSWRTRGFVDPHDDSGFAAEDEPGVQYLFEPGIADFSPGWFMQRQHVCFQDCPHIQILI